MAGGIGYIEIPEFRAAGREAEFAETGNDLIAAMDVVPVDAWIVDLRLNLGGSYSPMVSAVSALLGNGVFGVWVTRDGVQTWMSHTDGRIDRDGLPLSNHLAETGVRQLTRSNPPVAVLTSGMTGSSGEVMTLAFAGRPDTRSFGEKTAGLSTTNQGMWLYDGALLLIAASAMMDRFGVTHLEGIRADEPVTIDWGTFGSDDDPVLAAAVDWLEHQASSPS